MKTGISCRRRLKSASGITGQNARCAKITAALSCRAGDRRAQPAVSANPPEGIGGQGMTATYSRAGVAVYMAFKLAARFRTTPVAFCDRGSRSMFHTNHLPVEHRPRFGARRPQAPASATFPLVATRLQCAATGAHSQANSSTSISEKQKSSPASCARGIA